MWEIRIIDYDIKTTNNITKQHAFLILLRNIHRVSRNSSIFNWLKPSFNDSDIFCDLSQSYLQLLTVRFAFICPVTLVSTKTKSSLLLYQHLPVSRNSEWYEFTISAKWRIAYLTIYHGIKQPAASTGLAYENRTTSIIPSEV